MDGIKPNSKLLVAVSSPWASEKLAGPITDLAKRLSAEVLIAHVATIQEADEHESDATDRGEDTITRLRDALSEHGIQSQGVMLFGDNPAKSILSTAHEHHCTLIVLGLTGKGVLKRLISGDIPASIIRQSDLPVMLLPANWNGII